MKTWNNITIQDYYNLTTIINSENIEFEVERDIKLLSYVSGEPEAYYEAMPVSELAKHTKHIAFLSVGEIPGKVEEYITVDNQKYKVSLDAFDISSGRYIDIMHFTKEPGYLIKELHNIMAVLCLPLKKPGLISKILNQEGQPYEYGEIKHSYVADQMLNARYIDCYHTAGFFLRLWIGLKDSLKIYLTQTIAETGMMTKEEAARTLTNLSSVGDGLIMQNPLANLKT